MDNPTKPARDEKGRFGKDQSGNPKGRPKGKSLKANDKANLIPVIRNGRKRLEDPETYLLRKMALSGAGGDGRAQETYLRETRMRKLVEIRANPPLKSGKSAHSPPPLLYLEEALLVVGFIKRNREGHLVISSQMLPDLFRVFPLRTLTRAQWSKLELALDDPKILTRMQPSHRLKYKDAEHANWAREKSIDDAFAPFRAMQDEVEQYERFKRARKVRKIR